MTTKNEFETAASYRVNITYPNGSVSVLAFTLDKVYNLLKQANYFISFEVVRTKE